MADDDLRELRAYLERTVGFDFPSGPYGWPNEIEAALLDAVFSIRARYGGPNTGVRAVVRRWQAREGAPAGFDDLSVLAQMDPEVLAQIVGNRSRASGRLKAAIVVDAAGALQRAGLRHAAQFDASTEQEAAYVSVHGCGPVTWSYFGMLLGHPDVKADTWIIRYVSAALNRKVTSEEARQLLVRVAQDRGVDPTRLDHEVWNYARKS